MNTDPDSKLDALLHAARGAGRDTSRAELGFETRLMARLREERGESVFSWAWKLAPFFAALAIAAGLWSGITSAPTQIDASAVAEVASTADERMLMAYMTGERR